MVSVMETPGRVHIPRVFVVCESRDTATLWGFVLREKGLNVTLETSLERALEHWSGEASDVIVIDAEPEKPCWLELCKSLRMISTVPMLLLLPAHHETIILDAYAAGLDDVVVKPISPMVFQAKVLAWARRSWTMPVEGLTLVRAGRYQLDPAKHCLVNPGGEKIKLTNLEFNLLHLLMSQPGQVLDSEHLIRSIWGTYGSGDHILLKNVVYRLRKKIEVDTSKPVLLLTLPGGYSFQG